MKTELKHTVMLPTPAVWPTDRLAVLRTHLATQDPAAVATMAGSYGPESPIRRDGELITAGDAIYLLERWIAGRWS